MRRSEHAGSLTGIDSALLGQFPWRFEEDVTVLLFAGMMIGITGLCRTDMPQRGARPFNSRPQHPY